MDKTLEQNTSTSINLGHDFMELISLLWDMEQFEMWLPSEHGSVAYLLDRLSLTSSYKQKYEELYALAKSKNANDFAMQATLEIVEMSKADKRLSAKDISDLECIFAQQKDDYKNHSMFGVGIVKQLYMPDWFFELFHGYIKFEEAKREISIINYCQSEANLTREEAEEAYKKLATCYDIMNEFYFFVRTKRFKSFYPLTSNLITAKQLYETICPTPLDAYLYLVYLRQEKEKALAEYKTRLSNLKKIGEQNITENHTTCDANGNVNHEITVNDGNSAPKWTQDAIGAHLGEFVSANGRKFNVEVKFDSPCSHESKASYEDFRKQIEGDSKYDNISITYPWDKEE